MVLRRFILLAVALLLLWRITSSGMSGYHAEQLRAGDPAAAGRALTWNGHQPDALYARALALAESDPEAGLGLLAQAFRSNPADSRPLLAAARLHLARGDQARADALVDAAVAIRPADPRIQRQATGYWLSRGEVAKALEHASAALESEPSFREQLFAILLALAEDPSTRPALRPFAVSPPAWWEAFFDEAARRALDAQTVSELYAMRTKASRVALSEPERKSYVTRLIKEGRITEAYIAWINGLSQAQRAHLGLIHNGGFEVEPSHWGFDWRLRNSRGVLVERAPTYGNDGGLALHLRFERQEGPFAPVAQTLFLDPARYRLTGRVRTDSLESKGGLKWLLKCLMPESKVLGDSERFLGTNEWREFSLEFEVPETCALQELSLVSAGNRSFEYAIDGSAWFDRLGIRRIEALAER